MSFERDLLAALGKEGPPPEASEAALARQRRVVGRLAALELEMSQRARKRRRFVVLSVAAAFAAATALGAPLALELLRGEPAPPAPARAPTAKSAPAARAAPARSAAPAVTAPAELSTSRSSVAPHASSSRAPSTAPHVRAAGSHAPSSSAASSPGATSTLAQENELFARAKSEARQGAHGSALAHLDELLSRYPRSPLNQNARVERFRVLSKMGRQAEAARAARRYLADFPAGFARDEARALAVP